MLCTFNLRNDTGWMESSPITGPPIVISSRKTLIPPGGIAEAAELYISGSNEKIVPVISFQSVVKKWRKSSWFSPLA